MIKQSFKINKIDKVLTISAELKNATYSRLKSIDLTGFKETAFDICRTKLIIRLHSTAITDREQFETFIENVKVFLIVTFDKNTGDATDIIIDDITFNDNDTNDQRTAMFFHEEIEKELEKLNISMQLEA